MTATSKKIDGPDWRKGKSGPQVMVKSSWADAKPGDYFECYPDKGTFVKVVEGKKGFGTVVFKDGTGKEATAPVHMHDVFVFIRRPLQEGMPATASLNGDDYPCEVKGWSPSGHQVHVLWSRSKELRTFTRCKNGRYFEKGNHSGFSLMFGVAESRMNPEF